MYVCLCVRPFFNRREGAAGTDWKGRWRRKWRRRHRLEGSRERQMLIQYQIRAQQAQTGRVVSAGNAYIVANEGAARHRMGGLRVQDMLI